MGTARDSQYASILAELTELQVAKEWSFDQKKRFQEIQMFALAIAENWGLMNLSSTDEKTFDNIQHAIETIEERQRKAEQVQQAQPIAEEMNDEDDEIIQEEQAADAAAAETEPESVAPEESEEEEEEEEEEYTLEGLRLIYINYRTHLNQQKQDPDNLLSLKQISLNTLIQDIEAATDDNNRLTKFIYNFASSEDMIAGHRHTLHIGSSKGKKEIVDRTHEFLNNTLSEDLKDHPTYQAGKIYALLEKYVSYLEKEARGEKDPIKNAQIRQKISVIDDLKKLVGPAAPGQVEKTDEEKLTAFKDKFLEVNASGVGNNIDLISKHRRSGLFSLRKSEGAKLVEEIGKVFPDFNQKVSHRP